MCARHARHARKAGVADVDDGVGGQVLRGDLVDAAAPVGRVAQHKEEGVVTELGLEHLDDAGCRREQVVRELQGDATGAELVEARGHAVQVELALHVHVALHHGLIQIQPLRDDALAGVELDGSRLHADLWGECAGGWRVCVSRRQLYSVLRAARGQRDSCFRSASSASACSCSSVLLASTVALGTSLGAPVRVAA